MLFQATSHGGKRAILESIDTCVFLKAAEASCYDELEGVLIKDVLASFGEIYLDMRRGTNGIFYFE